jgi:hypothetical protein
MLSRRLRTWPLPRALAVSDPVASVVHPHDPCTPLRGAGNARRPARVPVCERPLGTCSCGEARHSGPLVGLWRKREAGKVCILPRRRCRPDGTQHFADRAYGVVLTRFSQTSPAAKLNLVERGPDLPIGMLGLSRFFSNHLIYCDDVGGVTKSETVNNRTAPRFFRTRVLRRSA